MVSAAAADDSPQLQADGAEEKDQFSEWVHALDSDRFVEREVATEKLIEAGAPAIPAIVTAVEGKSLEVVSRAVFILQKLALADQPDLENAARQALESLAARERSSAQQRAQKSLDQLTVLWQQRALEALKQLGARFPATSNFVNGVRQVHVATSIEFDDQWKGGEHGLKHLRWLSYLQGISFTGTQVKNPWLAHVVQLDNLRHLRLKRTKVTDDGISQLADIAYLQRLDIWYSPISDACVDDLARLKNVQVFRIYGTEMTGDGEQRLLDLIGPEKKLDFKVGGALLGVNCGEQPEICTIEFVQRESAAALAGLQKNDIILRYDDRPVKNFEDLKSLISKNAPGDRVTMTVQRGDQQLSKEVTLGEWTR